MATCRRQIPRTAFIIADTGTPNFQSIFDTENQDKHIFINTMLSILSVYIILIDSCSLEESKVNNR